MIGSASDLALNGIAPMGLLAMNFGIMWQRSGGINQPATPESLILVGAGFASSLLTAISIWPVILNDLN